MPRATVTFVCTSCGGETPRWAGQCPHCQAWNTLQEYAVQRPQAKSRAQARAVSSAAGTSAARAVAITEVSTEAAPRLRLGWDELNRVLGGGVGPGSIGLVGGEPGGGKSTLLMQAAHQVAATSDGARGLYASGEESNQQVQLRAHRLDALHAGILLLAETDLDAICDTITAESPRLAIV